MLLTLLKLRRLRLLFSDVNGVLQPEREESFSGQEDLLVGGERGAGRSRTRTCEASNQRSLATARDSANERPETCATADESRRALPLAFFRAIDGAGGDGVASPPGMNALEPDGQDSAAFESAQGPGVNYRALCPCATGDDDLPVHKDVGGNGGCEGVAGLRESWTQGPGQAGPRCGCRMEDRARQEEAALAGAVDPAGVEAPWVAPAGARLAPSEPGGGAAEVDCGL